MSTKTEKDKTKQLQDKCQSVLNALLRDEDNKYCVDCDSKGPRWASWNIGVFLCIRCAGIHRNLGVHISKVKSVNLDSWTPGTSSLITADGARASTEANLPDNFRRPQSDSALESFIRAKYEHKKYIAREWCPWPLPKVNWEKEIDEEIEKQKRKKKTVIEKKSLGAVEVPQIPKPTNPSPKPLRVVANNSESNDKKDKDKKDNDLLGLQNGDDSFSNFISAPTATEVGYQQAPFPATQGSFQSFGNFPQQQFASQNGVPQYPAQWAPLAQQWGKQGQFTAQNQFIGSPTQFPVQAQFTAGQAQMMNFQQQVPAAPYTQVSQPNSQHAGFSQIPNPFHVNQNLQQQFNNLSLGSQGANTAPTLATNTWQ
ncbi:hypothetical protein NQ317_011103 [Molorchus minor]|uniref:Arf-GAP domain-containing protein n=1 Tax=Molorchus minor TaxID=1323400 RepID=A0ABQ9K217_9CUCU|nr:hypothetical protein NQ317_011103 [Molorchus minor]